MAGNNESRLPSVDEHGHLCDSADWTPDVARRLAADDDVALDQRHWELLHLLRELYAQTHDTPPMRLLLRHIRIELGEAQGQSRHLYRLFADNPIRWLCKYAGLPRPPHCM